LPGQAPPAAGDHLGPIRVQVRRRRVVGAATEVAAACR